MFEEEHGEGAMVIEVFDSRTYTYIYGHIVVKAAEMREQGESFEAITSVIRSRLSRVEAYLGVYTLKYLKKSGRISGGAAFVGEALGLKADQLCLRRRGQGLRQGARRKGARGRHLQKVAARVQQPEKQTGILLYGDVPEERLAEVEKRMREEIGFKDVVRCAIGPSVLSNTGPLAIAVAYYGAPRE